MSEIKAVLLIPAERDAAKQAAQRDAEVRASGVEQAIEDIANEEAYAALEAAEGREVSDD